MSAPAPQQSASLGLRAGDRALARRPLKIA